MKKEKFLVTCALPYANGPLHVGHLAGSNLPGDVYAKYRKLQGHDVVFVCGTDEHGAAITFKALQENTTPQAGVDKYYASIKEDLEACLIDYDIFSRTTHKCHIQRSQDFFLSLRDKGFITEKTEKRLYCSSCEQYLPDRYVVGECAYCHSTDARGDQCEKCGTWYEPEELIKPICQLCKTTEATLKETTHWYLTLDKLEAKLKPWIESKTHWRKNVMGYALQPIKAQLAPRSITRDLTWGVPVPTDEGKDKVLYVWFEAPIGYISATEDYFETIGSHDRWKDYWEDKDTKLIHFIGKDNIVFHTVVWPATLIADGRYVLPDLVAGNEFLNLEGQKISTSKNFAIWVKDALESVSPDLLRYYLTRIAPETSDSDFRWADFQTKINTELADIIGNLTNRTLSFINKFFEGKLLNTPLDDEVLNKLQGFYNTYCTSLDLGLSKAALEQVIETGRFLNGYLQEKEPWKTRKEDPLVAHKDLTNVAIGIKALTLLLYPVCPTISQSIWKQLGFADQVSEHNLSDVLAPYELNHVINSEISPIVVKIEDEFVEEQRGKLGS